MKTHIQKWGNSFAIRLPMAIIEELNLYSGCRVDIDVQDSFVKIRKSNSDLDDLLSAITCQNMHNLQLDDSSQGQEEW